jgi:hypothetical protein
MANFFGTGMRYYFLLARSGVIAESLLTTRSSLFPGPGTPVLSRGFSSRPPPHRRPTVRAVHIAPIAPGAEKENAATHRIAARHLPDRDHAPPAPAKSWTEDGEPCDEGAVGPQLPHAQRPRARRVMTPGPHAFAGAKRSCPALGAGPTPSIGGDLNCPSVWVDRISTASENCRFRAYLPVKILVHRLSTPRPRGSPRYPSPPSTPL